MVVTVLLALGLVASAHEAAAQPPLAACGPLVGTSYILTKNITASGTCFTLVFAATSINFNGFSISGDGTGAGITDLGQGNQHGFAIVDGTIANFAVGIDLGGSHSGQIEFMRVIDTTLLGINTGDVRNSLATSSARPPETGSTSAVPVSSSGTS